MTKVIQAIRGMNDILPEQSVYWQTAEEACCQLAKSYGYREIRFPILEQTSLFQRTIGETTDIVEKEMYTFIDRNGDSLSLRPEGTAGCVRAGIEKGLFYNQIQRLWYLGPMFRHERPQRGRYRQFHQFGVEAYGMGGPDIDAELIALSYRLWKKLGLQNKIELQINSLGSLDCRLRYRDHLLSYYREHFDLLDKECQRRVILNPLRLLDSKDPNVQNLNKNAPLLRDHLDSSSRQHFERLCRLLDQLGIPYVINPHLVRGLDYYNLTVFEWITHHLGAQGTVCAGGRYDVLVQQLGGHPTPAVGFGLGLERLILLLAAHHVYEQNSAVSFILLGTAAIQKGMQLAEQLRDRLPNLSVVTHLSIGSTKSQFKQAHKSGSRWAVIIGEEELAAQKVHVKDLRGEKGQQAIQEDELVNFIVANNPC